jgi:type VI protein secretion system component Hcp
MPIYMKLEGIKGENPDQSMTLESFSWGASNPISTATGGGGGTGKVSFQDLSFRSPMGTEAPDLLMHCASGKHINTGSLTISQKQSTFLTITFTNVFITSYKIEPSTIKLTNGDTFEPNTPTPMNNVTFNFQSYTFQTAGGSTSGNTNGNPT